MVAQVEFIHKVVATIKADSEDAISDFMATHTPAEVTKMTSFADVSFNEQILSFLDDDTDADIVI